MSSSNNGGGLQSIPAASRKMVQSLKEIVNCPELEIYAMLKDCNMDPNEAVNRLLSQDPFHEVKSKREKKKENKEITESRFRGFGNCSSCGDRGGTDRYVGRAGSTQFSSSESGILLGKSSYKKENGTNNYTSASSLAFEMAGNNTNRQPPADSIIFERLSKNGRMYEEATTKHLNVYGEAGLRTLALSYKKLEEAEYTAWNNEFVKAKTAIGGDREAMLEKISDMMEKDLILIGATAVEDKLQKGIFLQFASTGHEADLHINNEMIK